MAVWDDMVKAANASLTSSQIQEQRQTHQREIHQRETHQQATHQRETHQRATHQRATHQRESHQSSKIVKRSIDAAAERSGINPKEKNLKLHRMERLKQKLALIKSESIKRQQVDVEEQPEAGKTPDVEDDSGNEICDSEVLARLRNIAHEEQSEANEDSEGVNHIDNLDLPNAMKVNTKQRGTVNVDATLNDQLTFQHDLVDVTREVLQVSVTILVEEFHHAILH